jgi:DNA-binding LacI/PurR family transcriptional regulator
LGLSASSPGRPVRHVTVSADDAVAVQQAYSHLRPLAHKRIGLVLWPEDPVPSSRKLAGFADAVSGAKQSTVEFDVVYSPCGVVRRRPRDCCAAT